MKGLDLGKPKKIVDEFSVFKMSSVSVVAHAGHSRESPIGLEDSKMEGFVKSSATKDSFSSCLPVLVKPINKDCWKIKTDISETPTDAATGQKRRSLRYDSADSSDR